MPISAKLAKFLSQNKVKYEEIKHRQVFTGLDKAATLRAKPNLIAKTIILKSGKDLAMAVLAANRNLNKKKFAKASKLKNPDFVSEILIKNRIKGFKVGAIPPFGQLFKMLSFIDRGLFKEKMVFVSAGNYETSLKLSPKVLEKLGAAKADFSEVKKITKPKKAAKTKTKK
ncbi:MAG: YbaK/EbsC family protein [bacterium]|nr:YbaK/EbsC family protein [bacterium]